ncbi:hypothetical protein Tco_1449156, partial [Tanacetum coccineum]
KECLKACSRQMKQQLIAGVKCAVSDANKAIEMDAWLLYGLLMKVYDYNWLYAAIIGEKPNVEWNHVSVLQSAKQASQFAVMLELFDCSC